MLQLSGFSCNAPNNYLSMQAVRLWDPKYIDIWPIFGDLEPQENKLEQMSFRQGSKAGT